MAVIRIEASNSFYEITLDREIGRSEAQLPVIHITITATLDLVAIVVEIAVSGTKDDMPEKQRNLFFDMFDYRSSQMN